MKSDLLALAAIALWGTLAALGVELAHVPPFLLTGLGLLAGSLIALPLSRWRLQAWKVPLPTLLVGIYGLFGFHWLLFLAPRSPSSVAAARPPAPAAAFSPAICWRWHRPSSGPAIRC